MLQTLNSYTNHLSKQNTTPTISEIFSKFLDNLKIDNADNITCKYEEITVTLNKKFRDTDSRIANSLQVGSYGRWTGIKGISDLDILYIMPKNQWKIYKDNQSKLLKDTKEAIKARYPNTDIKVDRLVVIVTYSNFQIEIQPVFETDDGDFKYPDTYSNSWKITKPLKEISAMKEFVDNKNKNLRKLCKMARAWKNKHGVVMGGLLIDTLAYNFLKSTDTYDNKGLAYYDVMVRDFFKFLSEEEEKDHYKALGSNQNVKVKKPFHKKAKKAYELSIHAINAKGKNNQNNKWKKIFGRNFPISLKEELSTNSLKTQSLTFKDTEQFIEDYYSINIKYFLKINCEITEDGSSFRIFLRNLNRTKKKLPYKKRLCFYVEEIDNQIIKNGSYQVKWKILNRGHEAQKRDCIRGQIIGDDGTGSHIERTDFTGDHIVECYIIQNNVVVARNKIDVPIE